MRALVLLLVVLGLLAAPVASAEILRRASFSPAVGVTCLEVRDPSSCLFAARVALGFMVGELHVGALAGASGGQTVAGLQLGLDLGTPYFQLMRGRAGPALALAVRGSLDHDLIARGGSFSLFAFTNTYGPNLSIGLGTRRASLWLRVAAGFSAWASTNARLQLQSCCAFAPALDASVGVNVWL